MQHVVRVSFSPRLDTEQRYTHCCVLAQSGIGMFPEYATPVFASMPCHNEGIS